MSTSITVTHHPEKHCFEATVQGLRCMLDYRLDGRLVHMTHTYVPPALEGQGIAAQLVEAGLGWAQNQGLKVNPACSYVRNYLKRHPEWQGLKA